MQIALESRELVPLPCRDVCGNTLTFSHRLRIYVRGGMRKNPARDVIEDSGFQNLWKERSLARLFSRIRETMPQDKPGTLSPEQTADIIAHILRANQLPPGDSALPSDLDILKEIGLDAGEP